MIRRPPRSTRTDTLFPNTTLFRSLLQHPRQPGDEPGDARRVAAERAPVGFQIQLANELDLDRMACPFGPAVQLHAMPPGLRARTEERRVGTECVRTWSSGVSSDPQKKQARWTKTPTPPNTTDR